MTVDEGENAVLKVYHITDEGVTEHMGAADSSADGSASINIEAKTFSVYMLIKETTESYKLQTPALRAEQNNVITEITALLEDGSGPVGDVGQWQVFRLNAEFLLPNGQIHAGDTTTITLPDKLQFDQTESFEIKDNDGNVVANAVIDGTAKTITLTYTDFPESHSDVGGSFYFYVKIDRMQVDEEEIIPLNFNVGGTIIYGGDIHFIGIPEPTPRYLSKSGRQVSNEGRKLHFQISVNTITERYEV